MDNSLLDALAASFGIDLEPETHTVRGLLRFLQGWTDDRVHSSELHAPCFSMASRLRAAARDTWQDLEANPDLSEDMKEPVQLSAEAYEASANLLERFPGLAEEGRREEFVQALQEYEAERQLVLDANQEIAYLMSDQLLRCPRCGEGQREEETRCAECRLSLLYPDPKQLQDESWRSASLPPVYQEIYRNYLAVLKGERSLEALIEALPALTKYLQSLAERCRKLRQIPQGAEALRQFEVALEASAMAVNRMTRVQQNRQTRDLNRAWEDLFDSALSMVAAGRSYAEQKKDDGS